MLVYKNIFSILIFHCSFLSTGIYKAVADNGTGKTVETACTVTVGSMYFTIIFHLHLFLFLGKPKVEGKPTDVTVNVEQPAVLECAFSGFPKPEVTWFKD